RRLAAVVDAGDQHDGALQALEVGLELGLEIVFEHGGTPSKGKAGACDPSSDGSPPAWGWTAGRAVARTPVQPHPRRSGDGVGYCLDLADQVQRRLQGLLAFLPLGRADLARVGGDVLGGLDLAQELQRVAADALGGDLDR